VGPRAGLEAVENRKILPCRERNPGPSLNTALIVLLNFPLPLANMDANSFHVSVTDYVIWASCDSELFNNEL
jgi:hypothetical protein